MSDGVPVPTVGLRSPLGLSVATIAAGLAAVPLLNETGPLSLRMLQHLAIMNVAAPLAAAWLQSRSSNGGSRSLALAGVVQMLLLWAWHVPAVQTGLSQHPIAELSTALLMLAAAIAFWRGVLSAGEAGRWSGVGALLVTGKLACLLGALLVFSARDLYAGVSFAWCGSGTSTLADQQLAGLLMITACPLSYLIAGTTMASHLLRTLDDRLPADVVPAPR